MCRRRLCRPHRAASYDRHARNLAVQLKRADRPDLAPLVARWLSWAAADLLVVANVIAPAPPAYAAAAISRALAVPPSSRRQFEGRPIVLVDDVMITEATLEARARASSAAGRRRPSARAFIARVKDAPHGSM